MRRLAGSPYARGGPEQLPSVPMRQDGTDLKVPGSNPLVRVNILFHVLTNDNKAAPEICVGLL